MGGKKSKSIIVNILTSGQYPRTMFPCKKQTGEKDPAMGGFQVNILKQIALVFGLFWVCQILEAVLPFPVPASVLSLLIMLVLLCCKLIKEEQVKDLADFLMGNLAFFFVPVAVGIMQYVDVITQNTVAFLTVCVVSTILTFGVTVTVVRLTQNLMNRGKKK